MSDIKHLKASDKAIMKSIGEFIKLQRTKQNKTQEQLAKKAGIARSTLCLLEDGGNVGMVVFIRILRALKLLGLLNEFKS
ncbi:MAG: helix-turn-helix domain-containing protein [Bacteroidales bacterium]|nr:helix-turn-helix domain-containing protein [Bacteroidales bacterium]